MEGENLRQRLGIDGTMGDAQDVPHTAHPSLNGPWCAICGFSMSSQIHRANPQATTTPENVEELNHTAACVWDCRNGQIPDHRPMGTWTHCYCHCHRTNLGAPENVEEPK